MTSDSNNPSADASQPCECELPGYFTSGVPGILARVEQGRLVAGAAVERCDLCQRFRLRSSGAGKASRVGNRLAVQIIPLVRGASDLP